MVAPCGLAVNFIHSRMSPRFNEGYWQIPYQVKKNSIDWYEKWTPLRQKHNVPIKYRGTKQFAILQGNGMTLYLVKKKGNCYWPQGCRMEGFYYDDLFDKNDNLQKEVLKAPTKLKIFRKYSYKDEITAVQRKAWEATRKFDLPRLDTELAVHRGGEFNVGRAGMLYSDLIPSRLGGRWIASHIKIPGGTRS